MPLEHDLNAAINAELMRIGAREKVHDHHLGHGDRVHYEDGGLGNVTLTGSSSSGQDFYWLGPAKEFVERLRAVPTGGGAEADSQGVLLELSGRALHRRELCATSPR
jgi:hypothetical protein